MLIRIAASWEMSRKGRRTFKWTRALHVAPKCCYSVGEGVSGLYPHCWILMPLAFALPFAIVESVPYSMPVVLSQSSSAL